MGELCVDSPVACRPPPSRVLPFFVTTRVFAHWAPKASGWRTRQLHASRGCWTLCLVRGAPNSNALRGLDVANRWRKPPQWARGGLPPPHRTLACEQPYRRRRGRRSPKRLAACGSGAASTDRPRPRWPLAVERQQPRQTARRRRCDRGRCGWRRPPRRNRRRFPLAPVATSMELYGCPPGASHPRL